MKKNIIALVSMLLAFVFIVSSGNSVLAAWDGYTETEVANDVEILVNMNKMGVITDAGLEISGTHTGKAVYSGRWRNHPTKTIFGFPVSKDCSDIDKIIMPVYSEKATGAKIFVIFRCHNATPLAAGRNAYFEITFNIDWTGWKTFEWKIDEVGKANAPDLSRPIDFRVSAKWGDAVPHPESDLYFDSVCYTRKEGTESESAETDVNFYNAMKGSVAVYNYNRNVYVNNGVELMDPEDAKATVLTKGGVSMVPVMFFEKYLNVETTVNESEIIFDNKMVLSTDNKEYTVDGERKVFESAPFKQGDKIFVPLVECCNSLGIAAKSFGELSVIGSKNSIGFVETDEGIYNKAVELTTKRMLSPENVTDEDFAQARKNFRISIVGGEGLYNPENERVAARLKGIQNSALSSWNKMNRSDDVFALFGTTPVTTTGDMTAQYQHLLNMAYGYGSYGTSTYKNPQLKLDILYGLEWLYENLYGEDEINNTGWIDTTGYNWWDWFIGVPNKLMTVLLIMEPEIYQSDIDKYISPFAYFYATRCLGNEKAGDPADSQGRILVGTKLAILNKDLSIWNKIYDDYEYSLKFAKGDGIRKDYSYIDHGTLPLAGMYGTEVIYNRLATAMACLSGTAFEMSSKNKYNLARWTYNTFDPLYFNGTMTTRVMGRSPEEGVQKTVELVMGAINMLGSFGPDDDAKLKNIVKSQVDETNIDRITGRMAPVQIAQLEKIINDNTVSGDREEQTRVYYESDMVVQHRKNYGVALVMSSERVSNYECINGNNKTGWYQGDGVLYVYPIGDKSQFQYGSTFWQKANMYRLPGITEDSQERKVWSSRVRYLPEPSFVGGTSVGDYAVAAMDFEAYHHDVVETGTDEGSGGALPYHDNDLVAKKSWFMFDDEIVALGSGITSTKNSPVYTVVENRQLKKSAAQTNYNVLSVSATGDDGNIPDNVVDGNLETRWSCEGTENVNLILELEKEEVIGYVGVAQYNGDEGRQATFDIDLSVDGENWVTMFSGNSSGTTTSVEYYDMKDTTAKYIRYNGHGRPYSTWNSVTEIGAYPSSVVELLSAEDNSEIYGTEEIRVNGDLLETKQTFENTYENPNWMHIEDVGGYYFPKGGNLTIHKTDSTTSFAEIWFNHGANPQNADYAYAIMPTKTPEEMKSYISNPDIEILSNTSKIHAVRDKNLGITGIVFWEAGTFGDITVSHPLTIMIKETGDEYVISASDPTQKLSEVNITLDKNLKTKTIDDRMKVEEGDRTKITMFMCADPGKTLTASFSK